MKKTKLSSFSLALALATPVFGADDNAMTLVYPAPAAEIELDNSTPAKRTTPPTREETEFDPMTPIGQIRAVKDSLDRIENAQEEVRAELEKNARTLADDEGFLSRFNSLFPLIERTATDGEKVKTNVDALIKTTSAIGLKIDALQKTTENLRATVEAAQKTAASIERIRESRWTDYAVVAILALVVIQLVCKVGATLIGRAQATKKRLEELSCAYEYAKEQLAKKNKTSATAKKESK